MSTFDGEETISTSPPGPNYGDLCDLAVQLTLALLDSDVFKHASNHLISTVPAVAFVRCRTWRALHSTLGNLPYYTCYGRDKDKDLEEQSVEHL